MTRTDPPAHGTSVVESAAEEPVGETRDRPTIERRHSRRMQLSEPYRWEFRLRRGFVEAVATDVGEGGLFVNIANPQPVGSEIDFEIQFADGLELIDAHGEVAWIANHKEQPDHAPGMGVRFLDLRGDSREVIRAALGRRKPAVESLLD